MQNILRLDAKGKGGTCLVRSHQTPVPLDGAVGRVNHPDPASRLELRA